MRKSRPDRVNLAQINLLRIRIRSSRKPRKLRKRLDVLLAQREQIVQSVRLLGAKWEDFGWRFLSIAGNGVGVAEYVAIQGLPYLTILYTGQNIVLLFKRKRVRLELLLKEVDGSLCIDILYVYASPEEAAQFINDFLGVVQSDIQFVYRSGFRCIPSRQ